MVPPNRCAARPFARLDASPPGCTACVSVAMVIAVYSVKSMRNPCIRRTSSSRLTLPALCRLIPVDSRLRLPAHRGTSPSANMSSESSCALLLLRRRLSVASVCARLALFWPTDSEAALHAEFASRRCRLRAADSVALAKFASILRSAFRLCERSNPVHTWSLPDVFCRLAARARSLLRLRATRACLRASRGPYRDSSMTRASF